MSLYQCRLYILAISVLFIMSACPDPQSRFDHFLDRRAPYIMNEQDQMSSIMQDEIPEITTGDFFFGLTSTIDTEKPIAFIASATFQLSEDRMGGQLTALSLQARSCDDITVEVGEPIVLEKTVEIAADGTFAIDFGRQLVANDANCISGSLIEATIQLQGQITSPDTFCGTVTGDLIQPFEYTLNGSTFAAQRVTDEYPVSRDRVPLSCQYLEASTPSTAGVESGGNNLSTGSEQGGGNMGNEGGALSEEMTGGASGGIDNSAGLEAGMNE